MDVAVINNTNTLLINVGTDGIEYIFDGKAVKNDMTMTGIME